MSETLMAQRHGTRTELTLDRSERLNGFDDAIPDAPRGAARTRAEKPGTGPTTGPGRTSHPIQATFTGRPS